MAKLPAEILDNIMQQLPSDADRASMALTCKEHAAHYENLKGKKTAGTNEYWLPRPQRVTDSHRLQLLVRLDDQSCGSKNFAHPIYRVLLFGGQLVASFTS